MRFAEMASIACTEGARVMLYPAAFNTTTGPPHWELLQRARAVDNFLYVATASPARSVVASSWSLQPLLLARVSARNGGVTDMSSS